MPWTAFNVLEYYINFVLPCLADEMLFPYLRMYGISTSSRTKGIESYAKLASGGTSIGDAGPDEMAHLARALGFRTRVYYSAGQGRFVDVNHLQLEYNRQSPAGPLLSYVILNAHFGSLVPRQSAGPTAAPTSPPAASPLFRRFVLSLRRDGFACASTAWTPAPEQLRCGGETSACR